MEREQELAELEVLINELTLGLLELQKRRLELKLGVAGDGSISPT